MPLLQVRFSGFRAIKAGLLADTFIEATHVEKTKLGYDDVFFDEESKRKVSVASLSNPCSMYKAILGSRSRI
jgi:hypothetical protein